MMGNEIFGLTKRPFIAEPVPEAYCQFGSSERARVQISRCVECQEGIALVVGRSGTGKTLLCRTIQNQFRDAMETVLLNGENLNHPKAFFASLLTLFEIPCDSRTLTAMRTALALSLSTSSRFQSGLLLLIDDAQAAAIRVFEEVRQLLDQTGNAKSGIRVVLFGNSGLEEKLAFPQLDSFSQRITTRCFLEAMNRDETTSFLRQELAMAGDEKNLFSKDVCREIHRFSDGIPRLANQLANQVLVCVREAAEGGVEDAEDSSIDSVKFEAWESDPFAIDGEDVSGKASGSESAHTENESVSLPEITPELVRKAWRRFQQLPEEKNSDSRVESADAPSNSGSGTIEFGSLDDDFDAEHTIELGSETTDDSTLVWSYDEAQAVADAVEEANAIPEEWSESARENAQLSEKRESAEARPSDAALPVPEPASAASPAPLGSSASAASSAPALESMHSDSNPGGQATPTAPSGSASSASSTSADADLWDVYHETSNIRFPQRKEPSWTPPSYSSSKPAFGDGLSTASSGGGMAGFDASSVSALRSDSSFTGSFAPRSGQSFAELEPRPSRNLSVDELIFDAIMDDTVHSMGLLQKILRALRDENLKNSNVSRPESYWLAIQELAKNSIRKIAAERQTQNAPAPPAQSPMAPVSSMPPAAWRGGVSQPNRAETLNAWNPLPTQAADFPPNSAFSATSAFPESRAVSGFTSAAGFASATGFAAPDSSVPAVPSPAPAAVSSVAGWAAPPSAGRTGAEDFYRPESLIEEGTLKRGTVPHWPTTPEKRFAASSPSVPSSSVPSPSASVQSVPASDAISGETAPAGPDSRSEELQKISSLRSVLQDPSVRSAIDSEIQSRISQMIARLETINQFT